MRTTQSAKAKHAIRVRALIKCTKLTQRQLARRLGVSTATINAWARRPDDPGHRRPKAKTLAKLKKLADQINDFRSSVLMPGWIVAREAKTR